MTGGEELAREHKEERLHMQENWNSLLQVRGKSQPTLLENMEVKKQEFKKEVVSNLGCYKAC